MLKPRQLIPALVLLSTGAALAQGEPEGTVAFENFLKLMQGSWENIGLLAETMLSEAGVGAGVGLFLGIAVGVTLYIVFLKKKWLDAPFPRYRYVKWIWAPTFVFSLIVAGTAVGFGIGCDFAVQHAIYQEGIVRKTAANLMCAAIAEKADVKLTGKEEPSDILAIIENCDFGEDKNISDLMASAQKALDDQWRERKGHPFGIWFMLARVTDIEEENLMVDDLLNSDLGDVMSVLYLDAMDQDAYQQQLKEKPSLKTVGAGVDKFFASFEKESQSSFKAFIYRNVILSVLYGIGIPVGLALMLRVIVRSVCPPPRR